MTATLTSRDTPPTQVTDPVATLPRPKAPPASVLKKTNPLSLGVVVLWVSVIVVLPLAALTVSSLDEGPVAFFNAITTPGAVTALILTLVLSAVVAVLNGVLGTILAWVLARDNFRGKSLVNALIDIPFALPTIVASIVLLALYGPESPLGLRLNNTAPGVVVALAFVTLPFVVRSVQPVLTELERDAEEAAGSLGAGNLIIVTRIIWPAIRPSVVSGTALAFARAVGEFGSVALIGGNIPGRTQVASQYIQQRIEVGDPASAAAVSVTLMLISLGVLGALRLVARDPRQEA